MFNVVTAYREHLRWTYRLTLESFSDLNGSREQTFLALMGSVQQLSAEDLVAAGLSSESGSWDFDPSPLGDGGADAADPGSAAGR